MKEMLISCPYYEDMSRISNSNIGWFITKGPKYLKDMLDGKEEGISGSFLEKGTMIHEYILQPDEFWKDYTILEFDAPKVKQQKEFCEYYCQNITINPLEDDDKLLLDAYNKAYSNSKSSEKKLEEAKLFKDTYIDYLKYLKIGNTRKVISFADLTMLKQIKTNLENHKAAKEILYDYPETYEVNNEFQINWNYIVECKSLLDRFMIDTTNKKVKLVDLKTTSDVYNFKHSIELYDYYRQIQYYLMAIKWYIQNVLEDNPFYYSYEAYIIAIQTNGSYEVRVFNMLNAEELLKREEVIDKTLTEISYHFNTGNWEHTRNYYEGDGIEQVE